MSDPNHIPAYAINTSTLPVYVLPPEQYSQQFGQATVQPGYPPQVYTQVPQAFAQPQSFYPPSPPAYIQTTPAPVVLNTQAPQSVSQKLEASLLATDNLPPCMGGTISKAFRIFRENCGVSLLWSFVMCGIFSGFVVGMFFLAFEGPYGPNSMVYILPQLVAYFVFPPLMAGFNYASLHVVRADGNKMAGSHFTHVFTPHILFRLIGLKMIVGLLTGLGMLLLIFPGVYLAVCFCLAELVFLEFAPHGLTIMQCLSISKAIVSRNWCWWFGFVLLIGLLACLPFCWPVALISLVVAFHDTLGSIENHDAAAFSMNTNL